MLAYWRCLKYEGNESAESGTERRVFNRYLKCAFSSSSLSSVFLQLVNPRQGPHLQALGCLSLPVCLSVCSSAGRWFFFFKKEKEGFLHDVACTTAAATYLLYLRMTKNTFILAQSHLVLSHAPRIVPISFSLCADGLKKRSWLLLQKVTHICKTFDDKRLINERQSIVSLRRTNRQTNIIIESFRWKSLKHVKMRMK